MERKKVVFTWISKSLLDGARRLKSPVEEYKSAAPKSFSHDPRYNTAFARNPAQRMSIALTEGPYEEEQKKLAKKLLALTLPGDDRKVFLLVVFNFSGILLNRTLGLGVGWNAIAPLVEKSIQEELPSYECEFIAEGKQGSF